MRCPDPVVSSVRFTPAPALDAQLGLLGFVACDIGAIRVDGIALRRSSHGRPHLRFPTRRRASSGREFPVVWPSSERAKLEIEGQILDALERQGDLR